MSKNMRLGVKGLVGKKIGKPVQVFVAGLLREGGVTMEQEVSVRHHKDGQDWQEWVANQSVVGPANGGVKGRPSWGDLDEEIRGRLETDLGIHDLASISKKGQTEEGMVELVEVIGSDEEIRGVNEVLVAAGLDQIRIEAALIGVPTDVKLTDEELKEQLQQIERLREEAQDHSPPGPETKRKYEEAWTKLSPNLKERLGGLEIRDWSAFLEKSSQDPLPVLEVLTGRQIGQLRGIAREGFGLLDFLALSEDDKKQRENKYRRKSREAKRARKKEAQAQAQAQAQAELISEPTSTETTPEPTPQGSLLKEGEMAVPLPLFPPSLEEIRSVVEQAIAELQEQIADQLTVLNANFFSLQKEVRQGREREAGEHKIWELLQPLIEERGWDGAAQTLAYFMMGIGFKHEDEKVKVR